MPNEPRRLFQFPWRSRTQIVRDVDTEIAFHLQMRVDELVATGLDADEARRRAREEFGDLERTRAYCRDVDARTDRGARFTDRLREWSQDATYAWRTIRRSPAFAIVSLLTLVLAIGANTAIFSVTRAVLFTPLPYGNPGSLVAVYESPRTAPSSRFPLSVPNLADYRSSQHTLTGLAAYTRTPVTWRPADGDPELLDAVSVTGNLFELLNVRATVGRTIVDGDAAPAAGPRVVLSYEFWQRAFDGDRSIVGRTITLNGLAHDVVGVMPRAFTLGKGEAMWTPFDLSRELATPEITRKQHYVRTVARLKPGVTLATAEADLRAIARRLEEQYPEANSGRSAALVPLHTDVVGDLRTALLLLQGAAGLVLLIACVNLANVTLSRTIGRRREMALRAALGAGRGRLVRQLLTESVTLAVAGGMLGIALAIGATRMLLGLNPEALPSVFAIRPDAGVLAFGLVVSIGTGIVFGLLPALDAARSDLHGSLKEGGRGASVGRGGERLRRGLVVTQVALAVVLLVGAGLLIRSFAELTRVRLGFDPDHVLTAQVRLSGERYDSAAFVNRFYDRVLDEVRSAPGIVAVGATMAVPTAGRVYSGITVVGEASDPARVSDIGYSLVRGDYFQTLGIPLRAGRLFDTRDDPSAPGTVILNEAAVRAFFPNTNPLGRRVRLGPDAKATPVTIIGVVGDTREQDLDVPPAPTVYASHAQNTWRSSMSIAVRTRGDPHAAESVVRRAVRSADPALALRDVRSLEEVLGSSLAARRFALGLVSSFAGVALLLAAVGIYGVLAFSVSSRTREFGVRLALGATNRRVLGMVLRQGFGWSLTGLVIGVAGAYAGGRLLTSMLYGVSPADATTFALVALGLIVVVVAACVVPAMRAMRVDPITSMRAD